MVKRLAVAALVAATGAACATGTAVTGPPAAVAPLRHATVDEVLAAWEAYAGGLQSLRSSGELEVRDLRHARSRSLGIRLVAGRGGKLYVKGSVAVVTALEVIADGERFWFQVPSKKTVWTGRAGGAARAEGGDAQAPYEALRPSDVLQALLPESMVPADGDVLLLEGARDTWALSLSHPVAGRGTLRRRVLLDRAHLRPTGLRVYDDAGDVESDVTLRVGEDGVPQLVTITRPRDGYFARLSLEGVERNTPLPEKAFVARTPADYTVVDVDQETR